MKAGRLTHDELVSLLLRHGLDYNPESKYFRHRCQSGNDMIAWDTDQRGRVSLTAFKSARWQALEKVTGRKLSEHQPPLAHLFVEAAKHTLWASGALTFVYAPDPQRGLEYSLRVFREQKEIITSTDPTLLQICSEAAKERRLFGEARGDAAFGVAVDWLLDNGLTEEEYLEK